MPDGLLQKVTPGQPLVIPAATFNAFIDAANDTKRRQQDQPGQGQSSFKQLDIVLVRNDTEGDRDRCDVVGVSGPIFTYADSADEFRNRVSLIGVCPADPTHVGKFAILLEPLTAGSLGRAAVAGVCPVQVDIADADDKFADIADTVTGHLKSGKSGAATILWRASSGTGVQWCIVRIGAGGDGIPKGDAQGELLWWDDDNSKWALTGAPADDQIMYWDDDAGAWAFLDPPTEDSILAWTVADGLKWIPTTTECPT